ncbi:hypothetical protein GCM10020218_028050 [Dactylosporangium vinaceum]
MHEAPAEAVPPLLAAPPWTAGGKPRKPIVVAGLECTDPFELRWAEGEREAGLQARQGYRSYGRRDFDTLEQEIRAGRARSYDEVGFFEAAPEALAAPLLENWRPKEFWNAEFWLPALVARYGLLALPAVLAAAPSAAAAVAQALQPVTGPPVAPLMAEYFGRLKTVRPTAAAWLRRHPEAAARGLVPVALGKAGAPRRYAERALYYLAGEGHTGAIRAAAQWYGPAAAEGIAALLDADPVQLLPARMPVVPDWAEPALLAPIELVGGAGSLPDAAARSVLMILAMSRLGEPYAGLAVVHRDLHRPVPRRVRVVAVAAVAGRRLSVEGVVGARRARVPRRRRHRAPPGPLIRAGPGESGHARAVAGLDVLAEIGTDVALMHLHGISEKGEVPRAEGEGAGEDRRGRRRPGPVARAARRPAGARLRPRTRRDAGPRLRPAGVRGRLRRAAQAVCGRRGRKRRKDLPKPGAKDDPQLAPAAAARFAALKKDVRTVAADQIRRFERAMVWQRRWKPDEFRQFIVEHPLVWHVARRLVWAAYPAGDPAGAALMSLRVAEDRTLAGADDEPTAIPDGALIGVAHPLQLGADLAAWGEVFADYEILQPFEQLSRAAQALTEAERTATQLTRQAGVKVPTTRVLGLERRGWRRAAPEDAGVQPAMERDLPGGDVLMLDLDPGIVVGLVTEFEHQTLGPAFILPQGSFTWNRPKGKSLGSLDPVTASEILRDLAEVTQ